MKNFVIINSSEVNTVNFDEVREAGPSSLRYSLDGTKTFVKYEGTQPFFLLGKTEYTHEEILPIMQSPEWASEEPI